MALNLSKLKNSTTNTTNTDVNKPLKPNGFSLSFTANKTYDLDSLIADKMRDNSEATLVLRTITNEELKTRLIELVTKKILDDYGVEFTEESYKTEINKVERFDRLFDIYYNRYYDEYKKVINSDEYNGSISLDTAFRAINLTKEDIRKYTLGDVAEKQETFLSYSDKYKPLIIWTDGSTDSGNQYGDLVYQEELDDILDEFINENELEAAFVELLKSSNLKDIINEYIDENISDTQVGQIESNRKNIVKLQDSLQIAHQTLFTHDNLIMDLNKDINGIINGDKSIKELIIGTGWPKASGNGLNYRDGRIILRNNTNSTIPMMSGIQHSVTSADDEEVLFLVRDTPKKILEDGTRTGLGRIGFLFGKGNPLVNTPWTSVEPYLHIKDNQIGIGKLIPDGEKLNYDIDAENKSLRLKKLHLGEKYGNIIFRENKTGKWTAGVQHSTYYNGDGINADEMVLFANSNKNIGWEFISGYDPRINEIDWDTEHIESPIIPTLVMKNNKVGINMHGINQGEFDHTLNIAGDVLSDDIYITRELKNETTIYEGSNVFLFDTDADISNEIDEDIILYGNGWGRSILHIKNGDIYVGHYGEKDRYEYIRTKSDKEEGSYTWLKDRFEYNHNNFNGYFTTLHTNSVSLPFIKIKSSLKQECFVITSMFDSYRTEMTNTINSLRSADSSNAGKITALTTNLNNLSTKHDNEILDINANISANTVLIDNLSNNVETNASDINNLKITQDNILNGKIWIKSINIGENVPRTDGSSNYKNAKVVLRDNNRNTIKSGIKHLIGDNDEDTVLLVKDNPRIYTEEKDDDGNVIDSEITGVGSVGILIGNGDIDTANSLSNITPYVHIKDGKIAIGKTIPDIIKNKNEPLFDIDADGKSLRIKKINLGEVGGNIILRDRSNKYISGIQHSVSSADDEMVLFTNSQSDIGWAFIADNRVDNYFLDPREKLNWENETLPTPTLFMKDHKVGINKKPTRGELSYNLDINGSTNSTSYYENGKLLSEVYATNVGLNTALTSHYTKDEVNSLLGNIKSFSMKIVTTLPEDPNSETIYLIVKEDIEDDNIYDEFVYLEGKWEKIGSTSVVLDEYALKTEIKTKLSEMTNDANYVQDANYVHTDTNFSTSDKLKLDGLANYNDAELRELITNKVEKDGDKILSTNDYTDADKTKLSDLPTNDELQSKFDNLALGDTNIIEAIYLNGTKVEPINKEVKLSITVPTKTSELTNDNNFITESEVTSSHYTKTETDTLLIDLNTQITSNTTEIDNIKLLLGDISELLDRINGDVDALVDDILGEV